MLQFQKVTVLFWEDSWLLDCCETVCVRADEEAETANLHPEMVIMFTSPVLTDFLLLARALLLKAPHLQNTAIG